VAATDTVCRAAHPQAVLRHPERLCIIVGLVAAQPQQSLFLDAQLHDEIPDRADHVLAGIGLVTGRDRRVRGEHCALPGGLECRLQGRSARRLAARQLEHRERGMPLVQVHNRWLIPSAARARTPPTPSSAYCERRVIRISDIQLRCDPALQTAVLGHIRVEQE
jgi:hypothetical protein